MKNIFRINEELIVEIIEKRKRTIVSIYDKSGKHTLTDIETNDYFVSKVVFDENYMIVYSRGCPVNEIPLNIEAAYDIKEKRVLDLSDEKLKVLLEYMFICTKDFELTNVLAFINAEDLKILDEEEKDDLKRILTSGNSKISDEEVTKYLLKTYPKLTRYRNLKGPLSVIEYKKIEKEIGENTFKFHLMPQSLDFLEQINLEEKSKDNRDYLGIYLSEYEHEQKQMVLKKNKPKN